MKIYYLPVPKEFKPYTQKFRYPKHNKDYGVEQDFDNYILENDNLLTVFPDEADYHYLSVYWTRYFINNNYGKLENDELQNMCNKIILDPTKTFTICQYDDGPLVELGKTLVFLSSRKTIEGLDIPLLSSDLIYCWFKPQKKNQASFIGRLDTHPIRQEMFHELKGIKDYFIQDSTFGTQRYIRSILNSNVSLCPRGYGGSSFRFFESMQLGTVPMLIGDIDTRPFKDIIDWDSCSFYTKNPQEINSIIDSRTQNDLLKMGKASFEIYNSQLRFSKWCNLLLLTLMKYK
jgi:hypothetical protein